MACFEGEPFPVRMELGLEARKAPLKDFRLLFFPLLSHDQKG